MITPMPRADWQITPDREFPPRTYLITSIHPVKANVALVITNSFGGVRLTQWMVLERFMKLEKEAVETCLNYVTVADKLTDAMNAARKFGRAVYGVDIADYKAPF